MDLNSFADERMAEAYEACYGAQVDSTCAEEAALVRARQCDSSDATGFVEIGYGTGHFTRAFAAQSCRVVGVRFFKPDVVWVFVGGMELWAVMLVVGAA